MSATRRPVTDTRKELPAGWRWVNLKEIGIFEAGGTPAKERKDYWNGEIPFVTGADITELFITKNNARAFLTRNGLYSGKTVICEAGTVIIVTRTRVGRSGIAQEVMGASQDITAFKCGPEIHQEFLCRYLHNISEHLIDNCRGATIQGLTREFVDTLEIPLPSIAEQKRIAGLLREQMAAVDKACAAAQARLEAAKALPAAFVHDTLQNGQRRKHRLGDCLVEERNGVGADWANYPILGATRNGLAPAKEAVGKSPERYKLVNPVTVFYNPMRILLGSIAMVDEEDATGITSPDYVVVKGKRGVLDTRWFYYWFRSVQGTQLINALSRGAVRERILFNRLASGMIELPDYETQLRASTRMRHVMPIVENVIQELETINALPAALLRRAFQGEL
ncbi:MAG: EcoKI restriction-modification system protein HsdS [Syntrophus sp. PtaB.Bin138]|nr:MAG: EcoKI restriction-modification system protein HsdS [Syntrophus sp. PtaB.Bin138]